MMSSGHPLTDCPDWNGKIPQARSGEFADVLMQALLRITASAAHDILAVGELCLWHRILFRRFVPLDYYAGYFRQDDAGRPCLRAAVEVGGVPGAPFSTVSPLMDRLIADLRTSVVRTEFHWRYLNSSDRAMRVALIIASAVGQFIRIHPFVNGNGRVSRLLWRWGLHRFGVPAQIRIAPRPDAPYSAIMQASMKGDDGPMAIEVLKHLAANAPRVAEP